MTFGRRGRCHLSTAAKKRISERMKKRWAERKKQKPSIVSSAYSINFVLGILNS